MAADEVQPKGKRKDDEEGRASQAHGAGDEKENGGGRFDGSQEQGMGPLSLDW
jgi:hypothetical protein